MLMFATFVKGETPFPEYSAVFMIDDIQLAYYDSNENQLTQRGVNSSGRTLDATDVASGQNAAEYIYGLMRERTSYLRQILNHTNSELKYSFQSHQNEQT